MGFKDLCPDVQKHFGMHPVTMEQPQKKLITLQSNCNQYSVKLHTFSCPPVFDFSTLYSEACNSYQFYLHPNFPKSFLSVPTPIKSLCCTLLAWIPEATHFTPPALHFPPCCQYTVVNFQVTVHCTTCIYLLDTLEQCLANGLFCTNYKTLYL